MSKLGTDVHNGTIKTFYADGDGGLVVETKQDVSPWIEKNKAKYNATDERAKWGELAHIASVPDSVILEWNRLGFCRGYFIIDQAALKKWLNNPDNKACRTRPGTI